MTELETVITKCKQSVFKQNPFLIRQLLLCYALEILFSIHICSGSDQTNFYTVQNIGRFSVHLLLKHAVRSFRRPSYYKQDLFAPYHICKDSQKYNIICLECIKVNQQQQAAYFMYTCICNRAFMQKPELFHIVYFMTSSSVSVISKNKLKPLYLLIDVICQEVPMFSIETEFTLLKISF